MNYLDVYYANLPTQPQLNYYITSWLASQTWLSFYSNSKKIAKYLNLHFNILNFHCNLCSINKSYKYYFGMNSFTTTKPLRSIYYDVWGPVEKSIDGFTYYVICVYFHTKYVWLYPMKNNYDISTLFPHFKLLIKNIFKQL